MERLRALFRCKTYHVEGGIVLLVLVMVAAFSDKTLVDYLGVIAIFFTFLHATIAEYLREAEAKRHLDNPESLNSCHHKLPYYFYAKEITWLLYFFLLGANAAIVGVLIFLLYQPWRRLWRKYHPL
jgi:hypothetical protein